MSPQVPEDHLKAIKDGFQKLLNDVRFSAAPEATAFLRLLGEEVGYMKTSEMRKLLETLSMYYQVFIRGLPAQVSSTSSSQNPDHRRTCYSMVGGETCGVPLIWNHKLRLVLR